MGGPGLGVSTIVQEPDLRRGMRQGGHQAIPYFTGAGEERYRHGPRYGHRRTRFARTEIVLRFAVQDITNAFFQKC